jgi:hypothetical protein
MSYAALAASARHPDKGIKAAVTKGNVGSPPVKAGGPSTRAEVRADRKVHAYEHTLQTKNRFTLRAFQALSGSDRHDPFSKTEKSGS